MNLKRELAGFNVEKLTLKKKTLLTYNQKAIYDNIEALPLWEWALSE